MNALPAKPICIGLAKMMLSVSIHEKFWAKQAINSSTSLRENPPRPKLQFRVRGLAASFIGGPTNMADIGADQVANMAMM